MSEKKLVSVNYTKKNILSFQLDKGQPLFVVKPGMNYIPEDIFTLMKKDAIIQNKFENGDLDVIAEAPVKTAAEIYAGLKPKDRKVTIQASTSVEELESYVELEKNKDLLDLIEKQIEQIKAVAFRDGKKVEDQE